MNAPNVLLITVDGLRYDRLSCSGYDRATTPTLDSVVDEGAACSNAISTGTGTLLSFPGILTSSYPLMYGGYAQLSEDRATIAEAFSEHGYATVGVNSNANLHPRFGWDRGFDVYIDGTETVVNAPIGGFESADGNSAQEEDPLLGSMVDDLKTRVYQTLDHDGFLYRMVESAYRRAVNRELPHPEAETVVDEILGAVEMLPEDRPYFLWAHFMETHSPYLPPKSYREQFLSEPPSEGNIWRLNDHLHEKPGTITDAEVELISDLYDASLRYFDDELDRLFRELGLQSEWGDTVFAFTADHGEQFREHGELTHCSEPFEEGVHVPLCFKLGETEARDVDGVTSIIDVAPTVLEAAIDDPDPPDQFHGRSLVGALTGTEPVDGGRTVFTQQASDPQDGPRDIDLEKRITGCRTVEWKFITSRNPNRGDKLFHLPSDPGEQENVVHEWPDLVDEFKAEIRAHYDTPPYTGYGLESAVDVGDIDERLEALGYVQK